MEVLCASEFLAHFFAIFIIMWMKSRNKKNNFMAPFYRWGSTASRLEPLRWGSLLFTTKFSEIPGMICNTPKSSSWVKNRNENDKLWNEWFSKGEKWLLLRYILLTKIWFRFRRQKCVLWKQKYEDKNYFLWSLCQKEKIHWSIPCLVQSQIFFWTCICRHGRCSFFF